jgi:hypothetical protein
MKAELSVLLVEWKSGLVGMLVTGSRISVRPSRRRTTKRGIYLSDSKRRLGPRLVELGLRLDAWAVLSSYHLGLGRPD